MTVKAYYVLSILCTLFQFSQQSWGIFIPILKASKEILREVVSYPISHSYKVKKLEFNTFIQNSDLLLTTIVAYLLHT